MSGDTMVVGAQFESSAATGVNGDASDDSANQAGAAYVFVRNGSTWTQQAYLKASNTGAGDRFGLSVAISGDTIVIGAPIEKSNAVGVDGNQLDDSKPFSGAAYVFARTGSTWSQQAYLKASNTDAGDQFGISVGIAGDTIVVGAQQESSSSLGVNGDESNNSAPGAGAAYVFTRANSTWTQQAYLKASNAGNADHFGSSIAINHDTIVVGAVLERSNATGIDGNQADNSAENAGAAYVFFRTGTTWSQQAYLKASNTDPFDQFGASVAVDGDTAVVGANVERSAATGVDGNQSDNSAATAGATYVFVRTGTTWAQQAYLKASNTNPGDFFGDAVSISGNSVVVAAPAEDGAATGSNGDQANNAASSAGAAYLFVRSGTAWNQQAYLKASNTDAGDLFGSGAAVDGDLIVVGGNAEDSGATGVDGDQSDDSTANAGAAYVIDNSPYAWKLAALAQLESLRPWPWPAADGRLEKAVANLRASLASWRWIGEDALQPQWGWRVFKSEKLAVIWLTSPLFAGNGVLSSVIGGLIAADHEIVVRAIASSTADSAAIATAKERLVHAEQMAASGRNTKAISLLRRAWTVLN